MENHILTVRGKEITVHIENAQGGHYIALQENGVTKKFIIKGIVTNYQANQIRVDYAIVNEDSAGNIIGSNRGVYEIDPSEFDYFYSFHFTGSIGFCIAKHCINGLLFRQFGVRCFDANLDFYQSITFDVAMQPTTVEGEEDQATGRIEVTVIDGIMPIEYSLYGQDFGESNVFENLEAGIYELVLRDANGNEATSTVEVTIQE